MKEANDSDLEECQSIFKLPLRVFHKHMKGEESKQNNLSAYWEW